jgi:NAD(P)H dehydrogenase (quinone)
MHILLIDGHPQTGRLSANLLNLYAAALPAGATQERIVVADLSFDPVLHSGYSTPQPWEPDLLAAAEALDRADHVVLAFPMWWGGQPALLKGFFDRLLQPHFAFRYHANDPWWDRLLAGRSADVLVTMDTPPIFLRFVYGNAVVKQTRKQIFDFCGFKPVRLRAFGPTRQDAAAKSMAKWERVVAKLAGSIRPSTAAKVSELGAFLAYRAGK